MQKIDKIKKIDKIEDKKYKKFDDAWRKWIDKNIKLGVSKKVISNILLEANFDPDEITSEINIT